MYIMTGYMHVKENIFKICKSALQRQSVSSENNAVISDLNYVQIHYLFHASTDLYCFITHYP